VKTIFSNPHTLRVLGYSYIYSGLKVPPPTAPLSEWF